DALEAGGNDYVTKPFDSEELHARVNVGIRMVELQQSLAERIRHIKRLQGILPICMYCKKVRNDQQYWKQVETYLAEHTDVQFSHCICPDCLDKVMRQARAELGLPAADKSTARTS